MTVNDLVTGRNGQESSKSSCFFEWELLSQHRQGDKLVCHLCHEEFQEEVKLKLHQIGLHVNPYYLSASDRILAQISSYAVQTDKTEGPWVPDWDTFKGLYRCHQCFLLCNEGPDLTQHLMSSHKDDLEDVPLVQRIKKPETSPKLSSEISAESPRRKSASPKKIVSNQAESNEAQNFMNELGLGTEKLSKSPPKLKIKFGNEAESPTTIVSDAESRTIEAESPRRKISDEAENSKQRLSEEIESMKMSSEAESSTNGLSYESAKELSTEIEPTENLSDETETPLVRKKLKKKSEAESPKIKPATSKEFLSDQVEIPKKLNNDAESPERKLNNDAESPERTLSNELATESDDAETPIGKLSKRKIKKKLSDETESPRRKPASLKELLNGQAESPRRKLSSASHRRLSYEAESPRRKSSETERSKRRLSDETKSPRRKLSSETKDETETLVAKISPRKKLKKRLSNKAKSQTNSEQAEENLESNLSNEGTETSAESLSNETPLSKNPRKKLKKRLSNKTKSPRRKPETPKNIAETPIRLSTESEEDVPLAKKFKPISEKESPVLSNGRPDRKCKSTTNTLVAMLTADMYNDLEWKKLTNLTTSPKTPKEIVSSKNTNAKKSSKKGSLPPKKVVRQKKEEKLPPAPRASARSLSTEEERVSTVIEAVTEKFQPFFCLDCDLSFESYAHLNAHKAQIHPQKSIFGKIKTLVKKEVFDENQEMKDFVSNATVQVPEVTFNNMHGTIQHISTLDGDLFRSRNLGTVDKVKLNLSESWSKKEVWESGWEPTPDQLSWQKYNEKCLNHMSKISWSQQRTFKDCYDSLNPRLDQGQVPVPKVSRRMILAQGLDLRHEKKGKIASQKPFKEGFLNGEWENPHDFMCSSCAITYDELREVLHHKWEAHPYALVAHINLRRDLNLPPSNLMHPQVGRNLSRLQKIKLLGAKKSSKAKKPPKKVTEGLKCSKCDKISDKRDEFFKHILECGGEEDWDNASKKKKKKAKKAGKVKNEKQSEEAALRRKDLNLKRFERFNRPPPLAVKNGGRMTRGQAEKIKEEKKAKRRPKKFNSKKKKVKTDTENTGKVTKKRVKKDFSRQVSSVRQRRSNAFYGLLPEGQKLEKTDVQKIIQQIMDEMLEKVEKATQVLNEAEKMDLDVIKAKQSLSRRNSTDSVASIKVKEQENIEEIVDIKVEEPKKAEKTEKAESSRNAEAEKTERVENAGEAENFGKAEKSKNVKKRRSSFVEAFYSARSKEQENIEEFQVKQPEKEPEKIKKTLKPKKAKTETDKAKEDSERAENQPIKKRRSSFVKAFYSVIEEPQKEPVKAKKPQKPKKTKRKVKKAKKETEMAIEETEMAKEEPEMAKKDTKMAEKDTEMAKEDTEIAEKDTEKATKEPEKVKKRRSSFVEAFYSARPKAERSLRRSNGRINYFEDEDFNNDLDDLNEDSALIRRKRPKTSLQDSEEIEKNHETSDFENSDDGSRPRRQLNNNSSSQVAQSSRVIFPLEVKACAVQRIRDGETQVQVARDLQCPVSTVASWWHRRASIAPVSGNDSSASLSATESEPSEEKSRKKARSPIKKKKSFSLNRNVLLSQMKERVEAAFAAKDEPEVEINSEKSDSEKADKTDSEAEKVTEMIDSEIENADSDVEEKVEKTDSEMEEKAEKTDSEEIEKIHSDFENPDSVQSELLEPEIDNDNNEINEVKRIPSSEESSNDTTEETNIKLKNTILRTCFASLHRRQKQEKEKEYHQYLNGFD